MRKWLLWFWLLMKRLYKKPAFLALLLLIPVLTLCYKASVGEKSGVVTVALAQEGSDPLATRVMEELTEADQMITYVICDDPQQARTLVQTGKADAAWIFPEDMEGKIDAFLDDPHVDNAVVTVLQREENVAHRLARERLGGQVYHHLSRQLYLQYMRDQYGMEAVSDEQLMTYYDEVQMNGSLFSYETASGEPQTDTHYLLTPIRGILGILGVLCALAAAMYYRKDQDSGTFSYLPQKRRPLGELAGQAVANGNVMLFSALALAVAGLGAGFVRELVLLVLYTLCLAAFGMLLRSVLKGVRLMAVTMPVLVVLMLLVCPVFLDLGQLRLWQLLLPPTYYILGAVNDRYLVYLLAYTAVCFALYYLSEKLQKKL